MSKNPVKRKKFTFPSTTINLLNQECHKLSEITNFIKGKGKSKAVLLHAWGGPEGSRKLRFPDFLTTVQDGGKVVSLTRRPHLPPENTPGTHFC
jgi:hypothetical protein